ncbi:MAG: hypothetical protein ACOYOU_10085 [Kiritimatiellia bacterium]
MNYPAIRIEGQIFSGELLQRLDHSDTAGQRPVDFGLSSDVKVKDEIARAWAGSQSYYRAFRGKISGSGSASFTTETRNLWLIPLLSLLGYKPEFARKGETLNGKTYPISHRDDARDGLPMHLLGWNDSLDKRRDDGSGPRMSPHGLTQEYLNLTEHLYALVSNGRTVRLLRDSTRLVRQSFIEFDLERMFDEDLFADFAVMFRLIHASRLPTSQSAAPTSLVEKYHQDALDQGSRIRDGLSKAVEHAILSFANGFLTHPDNQHLRDEVATGRIKPDAFFRKLPPPQTPEACRFRSEVLRQLRFANKRQREVAQLLVEDLFRTPSNRHTRPWYTEVFRYFKCCDPSAIEEALLPMLDAPQFSYRIKRQVKDIIGVMPHTR